MPFFDTWWQALAFGVVNLGALLVIGSFFHKLWEKYEDDLKDKPSYPGHEQKSCQVHHH